LRLSCKHVWPYISDFIDGSVTPEERRAIEVHLEHCEICSAILDSVHNILVLTADDRIFSLPLGYSERLHLRIAEELKRASEMLPGSEDSGAG
jgi:predicted anti-sigma-YlaC factor YlaD